MANDQKCNVHVEFGFSFSYISGRNCASVVKRPRKTARVAQSVERKALNLVVEGSSPSSGASHFFAHFQVFAKINGHIRDSRATLKSRRDLIKAFQLYYCCLRILYRDCCGLQRDLIYPRYMSTL